jgi:hypothetical protein
MENYLLNLDTNELVIGSEVDTKCIMIMQNKKIILKINPEEGRFGFNDPEFVFDYKDCIYIHSREFRVTIDKKTLEYGIDPSTITHPLPKYVTFEQWRIKEKHIGDSYQKQWIEEHHFYIFRKPAKQDK